GPCRILEPGHAVDGLQHRAAPRDNGPYPQSCGTKILAETVGDVEETGVDVLLRIDGQDGCERHDIGLAGVENRAGVDLVADERQLVLLAEVKDGDERLARVAPSWLCVSGASGR